MNWSIITATNSDAILNSCLLASPEAAKGGPVVLQKGFRSAAIAYNDAIDKSSSDILVFVHQDVYLPPGWADHFRSTLETLELADPNWGVLGIWGVDATEQRSGHLYCAATAGIYGKEMTAPRPVRTLDEVMLVIRRKSGLRFDPRLPGFHLYATDICLEAEKRGLTCYSIDAFCVHNANEYNFFPWEFWKNYLFIRNKWRDRLPIVTPCIQITSTCWPAIRWNIFRLKTCLGRKRPLRKRVSDPALLYHAVTRSEKI